MSERTKSEPQPQVDDLFPLSAAQEQLWFLEQLAPGTATYHVAGAVRLAGALDAEALAGALQDLVDRHEALRTSFTEVRGEARQQVHPEARLELVRTELGEAGRATRLPAELEAVALAPFDLAKAPLLRGRLLRLSAQDHVLALVVHHLVADGWSLGVLLRELGALYQARCAGQAARLPEPPIQYADYAVWQRARADASATQESLAAWSAQLAGAPERLTLPGAVLTAAASSRGALLPLSLGPELTASVRELARREKTTPFPVLLAGFQAALARFTGERDVVVGSPVSGRDLPETHEVVGLFVNLVALRARIDDRRSFRQLVGEVRATAEQARAHQHVPFELVVRALGSGGAPSASPLVQVVFAWQGGLGVEVALGEARGRGELIPTGTAKFEVTLSLEEVGGAIGGFIEYRAELYDESTIARLGSCLLHLLRSALAHPDAPLGALDALGEDERARLLAWSRGAEAGPYVSLLEAFAQHVAVRPESPALEHDGQVITYRALARRARQLSRRLAQLGVGRETLVGILMERGPAAVTTMLAAWQLGAAYVPLDPGHPIERLRYMISDAGVSVVCTVGAQHELHADRFVMVNVAAVDEGAAPGEGAPAWHSGPEELAYVIYTSGSTGRPKGVEVTHRGLGNLVAWHRRWLREGDRASQVASASFDASVWEIAGALGAGATLCFAPESARTLPRELRDWLLAGSIDVCFAPTPVAEGLLALDWPANSRLRLLLTGGDRLQQRSAGPFELVNNYGLTEAAVVSVSGRVAATGRGAPPIGRPISGHQVYVLDERLALVPAGAVGQLYLGGEGVARGYRGRPSLTAERFVPDPFSPSPGARLYRTGDLASFDSAGELLFHGRADDQVKLRGHRIELGEIVAALEAWPGTAAAVALLHHGGPRREPALAAYLVLREGATLEVPLLRRHLRQRLPEVMVPSLYFAIDEVPLTHNGKLDREALLRLQVPASAAPAPSIGPATPAQELIRQVWSELLGEEVAVGSESDFFELGGHSLLAAQMIGRLREVFGRDIPLRWAFEAPTVSALAARLGAPAPSANASGPRTIARGGHLPLSSAQERLWFLDRFTGSGGAYNIAGALRLTGALDTGALARTLAVIIDRHEVLRASFGEAGGEPYQQVSAAAAPELVVLDLCEPTTGRADPTHLMAALEQEGRHRFDLQRPPLLHARLFRSGPDEHVLSLVVHHIVADGLSIGVIVRELLAVYEALRAGAPSPLTELTLQYADYAVWQRGQLASGALAEGLAYWERRLAKLPTLALPTAGQQRSEPSYRGGTVRLALEPELCRALRELGRREGVTLFMTLLAGVQAVLARATGQDDVVVGTDVAGRSYAALEPLVGLFVNQLVLRGDLSGNPEFREVLRRVRPVVLEAWAHQDVPFNVLVERLRPARELGRNPLFQVMVILQDEFPQRLALGEVVAEPIELDPEGSVFDLSLAFQPHAGGLGMSLRHAASFGRERAERLLAELRGVLERVTREPSVPLAALEVQPFASPPAAGGRSRLQGLRSVRPRSAAIAREELVEQSSLAPDQPLPLVLSPKHPDVDLAAWVAQHRELLAGHLARVGGLLFRGFEVADVAAFRAVVAALSPDILEYGERSSPRTLVSDGVYTSTDHPPDQPILLHNEQSYTLSWPRRIWFCCLTPPVQGGRTPIADSRRVLARLRPETAARFAERQVRYLRNYGNGLGLSWPEAFQTTDRRVVESHCQSASIQVEWRDHDRLRTSQVRPAIRVHPETGERTWFNHLLFFHGTSLPPEVIAAVSEDELPYNTSYGDGAPIEPEVLAELRAAYQAETRSFAWQRGDLLVLDNMLTAHGREPFAGPRRVVVAMSDPMTAATSDVSPRSER